MKDNFGKAVVFCLTLVFASWMAAASANAKTVYAGSCGFVPAYPTIQMAVNNSLPGGVVKVCPGIYPEQVTVAINLTLEGFTVGSSDQAVVAAPAGGVVANTVSLATGLPIAAQIWVHDAAAVTVSDLVVDGSDNGISTCAPNLVGIYFQDASGTINHVVARNQTTGLASPINGCQLGLGIFVQSGVSTVTNTAGTSTVTVSNSSVHDFQKNGITGNEVGTTVDIRVNQVRGQGPTTGAAENGIQIADGAAGEITNNSVIDEIYAPCVSTSDCAASGSGILVFDAPAITVNNNHVGNTQSGISVEADGAFSAADQTITNNTLNGTLLLEGIDLCGSNGGTVSGNTVAGSGQSAIHLDSTCAAMGGPAGGGASVTGNSLNEGCAGILNGTTGNTVTPNTFFNVVNTILAGDSCITPAADIARAEISGSGRKSGHPNPARP